MIHGVPNQKILIFLTTRRVARSQKIATRLFATLWLRGGKNKESVLFKTHVPKLHALYSPLFKPKKQQSIKPCFHPPSFPTPRRLNQREDKQPTKNQFIPAACAVRRAID